MPESTSSRIVEARAVSSWMPVESALSRRPKKRAISTRAGRRSRISRHKRQFMTNRIASPPTSVTTCFARSIGISVRAVCSALTSFISRDISSPVRRRAKNPRERLCR